MRAPEEILRVWRKFDNFPMETLTKAWYFQRSEEPKQRSVELMELHREQYGTSGNCFDLAIWLMDEFTKEGIDSYAIGHDLFTTDAHAAIVAMSSSGHKYYCDLGDQWIQPILIDPTSEDYAEDKLNDFFPASLVRVQSSPDVLTISYGRPNGKESTQSFSTKPVYREELVRAGEYSQRLVRNPLVERRIFTQNEVRHWEFDNWTSFLSTNEGKRYEDEVDSLEQWAERINEKSGIDQRIILTALEAYSQKRS